MTFYGDFNIINDHRCLRCCLRRHRHRRQRRRLRGMRNFETFTGIWCYLHFCFVQSNRNLIGTLKLEFKSCQTRWP